MVAESVVSGLIWQAPRVKIDKLIRLRHGYGVTGPPPPSRPVLSSYGEPWAPTRQVESVRLEN